MEIKEPGHPVALHIQGQTRQGTGHAEPGHAEPGHLARYPNAAKQTGATDPHQITPDACIVVIDLDQSQTSGR